MLKLLLSSAIFFSVLSASTHLYQTQEWNNLFHIKNGKQSDISDPRFYLSNERTPEAEYKAALDVLKSDKAQEKICQYPARYRFLKKSLDLNISFDACENLNQYLDDSKGVSASISFASSYLESPMSFFGHTFITIQKPDNRFFSQTLSFAAEVPEHTRFSTLVYKGIGGGFAGKFVAAPYFKIFESYNMIEQRSISEYQLNLSEDEIDNMLWHAYELYDINVDYKFLTNNCAFETLWLIENARPGLNIIDKFEGNIVIPFDTIKYMKEIGLTHEGILSPSLTENLYSTYVTLNEREKSLFSELKNSNSKTQDLNESNLSNDSKNKIAYLINGYYDLLFKRYHTGKPDFDEVKQLDYVPFDEKKPIKNEPKGGSKIEIGYSDKDDVHNELFTFKAFSLNRMDEQFSELGDASLEILTAEIRHNNTTTQIDSLTLLEINSLIKRFDFFTPLSWKMKIGANRYDFDTDQIEPVVQLGVGASYGYNSLLTYWMPQVSYYPRANTIGIDTLVGISYWLNNLHLGLDFIFPTIYSNQKVQKDFNLYCVVPLHQNWKFKYLLSEEQLKVNIIYEF